MGLGFEPGGTDSWSTGSRWPAQLAASDKIPSPQRLHRYRSLLSGLAAEAGLDPAQSEEVAREVWTHFARTFSTFEPAGPGSSSQSWLLRLTRWRIAVKLRQHRFSPPPGAGRAATATDPEWGQQVLDLAWASLARRVPVKHLQVFELFQLQHWGRFRIARELRLNPVTVFVICHRLRDAFQVELDSLARASD